MIKLRPYYSVLFAVFLSASCKLEEFKKDSNDKVIQTAEMFFDSMQHNRFAEAYEYLHSKVKKDWKRRPMTLWDFSDYTLAPRFTLPDGFIANLMTEGQQQDWPKYLFVEIIELAHEQNAFPVDLAAYKSNSGSIEPADLGESDKICSFHNGDTGQLKLYLSLEGKSWKVLMIEQLSNGHTVRWPKGIME